MIDFPANPTNGQTFTAAGVTWTWDGVKWALGGQGSGVVPVTVSDTAPASPTVGMLWWDSIGGQLYLWYFDGNSSQWAAVTNQMGGGYLPLGGGTLTGPLTLAADPAAPLQSATKQYVDALPVAMGDNRIINGDMRIDQRNNGASGTAVAAYTVDRWNYGNLAGKGTWGRNLNAITGPSAFHYYLGFQSSSAYVSAAGDVFSITQPIEADMISDFAWGGASAQPVTLSFLVYSSLTGTFSGAIRNYAATRSYPFSFSLPTANTWTRIVLTIPGDIAGAWVMSGNGGALHLSFDLGSGSTYRGPAGVWAAANYIGVTGAVSVVGTNGATFYVTGVKLEIGSIATPYNRQSLAKSMVDCQRYYQISRILNINTNSAAVQVVVSAPYGVLMRAAPTLTINANNDANMGAPSLAATINCWWASAFVTASGTYTMDLTVNASAEL